MAHPADTGPKAPGAFAGARLSPEDCERLASMFRPSWELDDAPFAGPGSLSERDLHALQGGGIHADVRAATQSYAQTTNGAHAPPAPTHSDEPENSVIIDRTITAQDIGQGPAAKPAPAKLGGTMLGMAPPPAPQHVPGSTPPPPPSPARVSTKPPLASQRPRAPQFHVGPPTPPKGRPAVSLDLDEAYPRKSKTGLFVGVGVGAAAVLGVIVWLASSSGSSEKAAVPAPTETHTVEDKLSAIPPPPPITATPQATAAAMAPVTPPTTTVVATTPPAPIPTAAVTALPQAAPLPVHAAAAVPRANYGGGAPTPRPASKPKGGQTIVRDVPF